MKNPTLVFTFIGMQKQEIPIQTQTMFLNVIMQEETKALDDVVVTGYATIRKESFTGTSTKVSKADLLKVSPHNVMKALAAFDPSFKLSRIMSWDPIRTQCQNITFADVRGPQN